MEDKNYKIVEKRIDEIDLTLLIVIIPEKEIEDKLATLASENGAISRNFYEDFVITLCVANISKTLYTFNQHLNLNPGAKMADVRRKIYNFVTECNPYFSPEYIFINKNNVLKLDKTKKRELKSDEVSLVNNKAWELNNYEDLLASDEDIPEKTTCGKECSLAEGEECSESKKSRLPLSKLKAISDLDYEYVQKWWNRLNKYIEVKKFKEEDAEHILRSSEFNSRSVFNSHIVSSCIKDVRDLFEFLDSMGIPAKVSPPILMHELFDLCRQVNPFITFEAALGWVDTPLEKVEDRKKKKTGSMADYAKDNKKRRKFRDVTKEELLVVGDRIKQNLIGQDEAVDSVAEAVQRAGVGLRDPDKPIGSFLFTGSTGCGKTLCSKLLSKELTKEKDSLVIIDCSEYSADHEYAKLIGSPNGYVAHEQGGYLTNAVQKNPFSIVVFDEVEKASNKVHELLLQILDEGRLTDGKGNQVSFKDTIIIMTSNVGATEVASIKSTVGFGDVNLITNEKKDIEISKAIKKRFKPEFINRIDSIVYFKKLTKDDYMRIIELELEKLNFYLKSNDSDFKNSVLTFDNKIKNAVYKEGINEDYGARPLKRCIEKKISNPLSSKLLKEDISKNSIISVSAQNNEVVFLIEPIIADAPCNSNKAKELCNGCQD